ncbi:alpha-galactosidase [uncultured Prevotella sp.]|uniref:alpha-galactosidase n=1 Tax=uncultured Prevotella sp. TaxID=159272 RepID=UPI0026333CB9|nr:alpha-galactosidase [uncultured Prevotella sp.]
MKKFCFIMTTLLIAATAAVAQKTIRVSTDNTDLILQVNNNGRLYMVYLGDKLLNASDADRFDWTMDTGSDASVSKRGHEAYMCSGGEDFFEPALGLTHADGNKTTYLYYKDSQTKAVDGGEETVITLADNKYSVEVRLHYVAYPKQNVIKAWSEITNKEKGDISLWKYASTMLYFGSQKYYLTNYHGDWAREAQPAVQELTYGKKVIDTKLGTRAAMHTQPFFELGLDAPAAENTGRVMLGTIAWTGNFSCTFEVDNVGGLRVIPGINPYASDYKLKSGKTFVTPEFIFTLSNQGTGLASRNLHDWARLYQLKDGTGDRMTLLNNWESTAFDFNQESLAALMKEAKNLGVDMFLLDDGWFANKYPRNDDKAGLGDWEPNHAKLPGGVKALTEAADEAGVKFGIWIEPEMVNPKSELFEKHPDWVIMQPERDTYYYRNQLVLDLSNPEVQDYVYDVVDNILKENPGVAYFKWDCNSPITNIHSPYLRQNQDKLYIDYVRGLYNVLNRIAAKYPHVPMMLCSGGGARCDYEALKYFTEFWCSDNTDPFERIYIQWSMSKFFPVKAMASHVTEWNKNTSMKFRLDVASMCKLGFDIDVAALTEADRKLCREAVANYDRLKPVILDGDMFKLVSPYEGNHAAVNYVTKDKKSAVVFAYDLHPRYKEPVLNLKLQGLDPTLTYNVNEINLADGQKGLSGSFTGDYLMKIGLPLFSAVDGSSRVLELKAM